MQARHACTWQGLRGLQWHSHRHIRLSSRGLNVTTNNQADLGKQGSSMAKAEAGGASDGRCIVGPNWACKWAPDVLAHAERMIGMA